MSIAITLLSFFNTLIYAGVALKDLYADENDAKEKKPSSFLIVRDPEDTLRSSKRYVFPPSVGNAPKQPPPLLQVSYQTNS